MTSDDRRRSPRIPVWGLEVSCAGAGVAGLFPISDLSREGALLAGGGTVPIGQRVDMQFDSLVKVAAKAVRYHLGPFGRKMLGVAFESPNLETNAFLRRTMRAETERDDSSVLVVAGYGWPGKNLVTDLMCIERKCITARSATEAMAHLYSGRRVTAVIVETARPELDGMDLLGAIADQFPDVARLVMSGPIPDARTEAALDSGLVNVDVGTAWTFDSLKDALV